MWQRQNEWMLITGRGKKGTEQKTGAANFYKSLWKMNKCHLSGN